MPLRLAIGQIGPKKGDYAENLRRIGGVLAQLGGWEKPPQLVVFPETAISGYFVEAGVREVAVTAGTLFRDLAVQHSLAGAPPIDIALGFYEEFNHRFCNSALYAALGGAAPGIRHVHRKVFLPTYGVFDEERFVDRGHQIQAFDTTWGRAAMVICEDAWHSIVPSLAALDGAQVIIVPSAAPGRGIAPAVPAVPSVPPRQGTEGTEETQGARSRPASVERWERLVRGIADENGVFVALAQLVGFEGGKGFPGGSAVVGPGGDVLVRGPLFQEAIVTADLDLADIARARAEQPLLADLETELPHLLRSVDLRERVPAPYDPEDLCPRTQRPPAATKHTVVSPEPARDPLAVDPALVEQWLVAFLKDEVVRRRGYAKGIVGLSGGVDSALVAVLAARALGPENVIGLRLPYKTSSPDSLEHAALVAQQTGIQLLTLDITPAVDGYLELADPTADPTRRGNVAARVRMTALFDMSAKHRALPLGTSNKSERLMGYFTWHGDDAASVNPLGDLFKTQVWAVARHVGIPEVIVDKPATADLVQGQTDEDDLGVPYARLDPILCYLLQGLRVERIVGLGFSQEDVELVRRRLGSTHWKRRLATVAMVSQTAVGEYYLRPVDY
ncbi:MAG: NAD+ synthase [Gemmatimonadetes bacterium]|nr:NAD+ synthase [Gemmatimonadota bacterium]